jgi:acyl-CoA reductase-like NAD-dependent aldehyde dehydrogenase
MPVRDACAGVAAHVCRASRKDLRDAVEAARAAQVKWAESTAYLRGQVLYRLAEMMEGKRAEFVASIGGDPAGARREVSAAIDRVVAFAGWPDKVGQVLGGQNAVAGPYHNFTIPEPVGVVGVVCPEDAPLLAMVSLCLPAVATGSGVVALASGASPIPAMVLAEALATSDLPGGVWNILTGDAAELVPQFASHRGIDGVHAGGLSAAHRATLREGAAENLKRVRVVDGPDFFDDALWESPRAIEPFVEFKTIWHPSAT